MEVSVEASIEDMGDMKASTEVTSTGPSTNASTKAFMEAISTKGSEKKFMAVMKAFVQVLKA